MHQIPSQIDRGDAEMPIPFGWFAIARSAEIGNSEIRTILRSAEMQERYHGLYLDIKTTTPAEFGKMIAADHDKWASVVKSSGAKID